MRNFKIILIVLFMVPFCTMAQSDGESSDAALPNIIKINPIGFAFGNFNLNYERALNQSSSVQVGANFFTSFFGEDVSGFGFRGSYRFYITNQTKPAPEGFYTGLTASYNSFTEDATDDSVNSTGVGLLLGYQWVWTNHIALDLGIGPTYVFGDETSSGEDFSGIIPNIVIALGYNF